MSSINSLKKEYENLKLYIDDNINKVATAYEDSMVCSQDSDVISIINGVINNIDTNLKPKVRDAKDKSDIDGYSQTKDSLGTLEIEINALLDKLNDELCPTINTKSNEAYDELKELFVQLDSDYSRKCGEINSGFRKYDQYDADYLKCNTQLTKIRNLTTGNAVNDLLKQVKDYKAKRDEEETKIKDGLIFLKDTVKPKLEELLKDGLKKSNTTVIGGSNPSVTLPNGTTASLY